MVVQKKDFEELREIKDSGTLSEPTPEEYDFTMYVRIEEIRMLYNHICYAIETLVL